MSRVPKMKIEVKKLAQAWGPDAIDTLAELMNDARQPGATRVAAAKELLDRGFGKSTQFIAGDDDAPPIQFTTKIEWDKLPLDTLKQLLGAAKRSSVGADQDDDAEA